MLKNLPENGQFAYDLYMFRICRNLAILWSVSMIFTEAAFSQSFGDPKDDFDYDQTDNNTIRVVPSRPLDIQIPTRRILPPPIYVPRTSPDPLAPIYSPSVPSVEISNSWSKAHELARPRNGVVWTGDKVENLERQIVSYGNPALNPFLENDRGFVFGTRSLIAGLLWDDSYVSFESDKAISLKVRSGNDRRRQDDPLLEITSYHWDEEKQVYLGAGNVYGRGYSHCSLYKFPATFEISVFLGGPFLFALSSIEASYNTQYVDRQCQVTSTEPHRFRVNRVITNVELIEMFESQLNVFRGLSSSMDLKLNGLLGKVGRMRVLLPYSLDLEKWPAFVADAEAGLKGIQDQHRRYFEKAEHDLLVLKFGGSIDFGAVGLSGNPQVIHFPNLPGLDPVDPNLFYRVTTLVDKFWLLYVRDERLRALDQSLDRLIEAWESEESRRERAATENP